MNKQQLYSILAFLILLLILLFGFRTKPSELIQREKVRSLNLQSTNVNILIQEAIGELSNASKSRIQILESQLSALPDSAKAEKYKELSSTWFEEGQIGIAGHYAEQVAILTKTGEAWGIAGTTYAYGIKQAMKEKEKSFCPNKALESLENAISLDPDEINHQLNRAVVLAENPPAENPMMGVQQLLSLNKKFPKNVTIINNIAKFAIQTNQLERAEQRLLGAMDLEPNNNMTICLLANLYETKGDYEQASVFKARCTTE